ncbi:MAG: hypothetical protein M0P52_04100 [Rhodoferax sp.]|nr:hypothetical protein [Rhodoferax sp.]
MRTTLDLPDETFRQLKAQAAMNGLKLKELVTQLIEHGLAVGMTKPPPSPQSGPCPIPIAREADGTVTPFLSNAQLGAVLDEEDLTQYQKVLTQAAGR